MIRITPNTASALANAQLQRNLRKTLGKACHSRDEATSEVSNWQELRQYAHDVKAHTLARLDHYLEQLESRVIEQGGQVIWAETAAQARDFVIELARQKQIGSVVKSKSMLTEELHLNKALEQAGIRPVETDLGEYIVHLAGVPPSHITGPALHMSRQEIAQLMVEKVGMPPTEDPEEITMTVRRLLRRQFLSTRLGITGVNFAIAETGTIVVVENEGNAWLAASTPEIHVAIMGIEKVIPRVADLAVFLKLLTRSATGQKITSYVNLMNGARRSGETDGPEEFYLVLVDNGRSKILEDSFLRQTLACIRCGACLNVCPVYQSIGGHAYASTYQGPIGAILTPQLLSHRLAPEHPHASSLCGACYEVCPVKIEIPHILLKLRERGHRESEQKGLNSRLEKWGMKVWAWTTASPVRFNRAGRWLRLFQKPFQKNGSLRIPFPPFSGWSRDRELPSLPEKSFRQLYRKERDL
ncbi:MAG: LutB/LldF family L-lactate oxidation iron-sulfur protein [Acidobacteriota bacterium]